MNTDLELLKEQARQFEQLKNAPELLRQAEAEQRQQEYLDRAALEAGRLEVELATVLANFQPLKQESDSEFAAWVRAGKAILQRRQQLGVGIFELAEGLAEAQLTCGLKRSPLLRQDAIRATAEDELKRRIGTSHPMPITSLERDLAAILDALTAPPRQPAYYPMPETSYRQSQT